MAVGIALVGAGYWGRRLARNLAATDGCDLRVVADRQRERARALVDEFGGVAVSSLSDVLADDSVPAIVLATPSSTHAAFVADALAASRHVLVEKPLAGARADAARLAAEAADRDLVIMCDQTYRFAPAVASIAALLAAPEFGPLDVVESRRTNAGHDQPDADVFWDLAYHDLAVIDAVAAGGLRGHIDVRAVARDVVGRGRAHQGELDLELSSATRARVSVDWYAPTKMRTMRFVGERHEVTWDDLDGPRVRRDGVVVPVASREPLAAVVAEFVAAIEEGRPAACGPEQELPILAVLAAATESAAAGGLVVGVDASAPDDDTAVVA